MQNSYSQKDVNVYGYYKSFIQKYNANFEGYSYVQDSLAGKDNVNFTVNTMFEKNELQKRKNQVVKILKIDLDSIYKTTNLKLPVISANKFESLPNNIEAGVTKEEFNATLEVNRLHNLIMTDEKNKGYYSKKIDSIFNSGSMKSYKRKIKNSQKRLLVFLPPFIYGKKLVLSCISFNSIADSDAFYEIYTLN